MENNDVISKIRELKRKKPFAKFRIVLENGIEHLIVNPDGMAIGRSVVFYYLPGKDAGVRVPINQIVAVEENVGSIKKRKKKAI